jgi:RNA polymerase sigma-70 factor, ECF subfamily
VSESTPDEILMAAYQAGNEAAFGELFERYAGRVYGFLVRRLADKALAEDLYQEAFLRLHKGRASYDSNRPFRAWLFGIVHNLVTDTLRSQSRVPQASPMDGDAETEHATRAAGWDEQSPERLLVARQATDALGQALNALPSDEATVLILARFEGLSYEDIGVIIGRSPAATKQLAYRALKRVRAEMVSLGHEDKS